MSKPTAWSETELKVLHDVTLSKQEVAKKIGRSVVSVERKRDRLGVKHAPPEQPKDAEYWRSQFKKLQDEHKAAEKEQTAIQILVDEVRRLVPISYAPAPSRVVGSARDTGGKAQTAHLLLSDTHTGQHVSPAQTLGLGGYSPALFLNRLKYVEESVLGICTGHVTTKIDELVVGVGGDMIHGDLQHANEAAHLSTITDQVVTTAHALAQFLRNLAPSFRQVRIYSVVGNHARWQNQKKMPTVNRYSNFDTLVYHMARALLSEHKNVVWELDEQPFALYKIYGFLFHLSHGDHLRGGDKAMGIPAHALGRELSFNAQTLPFSDWAEPPHFYLCGHFHRPMELPHARGDIIINGGFPGVDNYALNSRFNTCAPLQKFFLVHPVYGRTATYNLHLSHGDTAYPKAPYQIP